MPVVTTPTAGWHPDVADHRDLHLDHEAVSARLSRLKAGSLEKLPGQIDWREFCGPIEDQAALATSSAHACVALVQQFERRASGRLWRPSRMFAHAIAASLHQPSVALSDIRHTVSLRDVFKAIVRCGLPPEKHWPYDESHAAREPGPLCLAYQREVRRLNYVRLDHGQLSGEQILLRLRTFLAAGFTFACGFPLVSSVDEGGEIPFPTLSDEVLGGHAVTAVGYDDARRIRSDKGALLIRNSWGRQWGEQGFGWLPYAYVRQRLAVDFWTLLKPSWLKSGEFEFPE